MSIKDLHKQVLIQLRNNCSKIEPVIEEEIDFSELWAYGPRRAVQFERVSGRFEGLYFWRRMEFFRGRLGTIKELANSLVLWLEEEVEPGELIKTFTGLSCQRNLEFPDTGEKQWQDGLEMARKGDSFYYLSDRRKYLVCLHQTEVSGQTLTLDTWWVR